MAVISELTQDGWDKAAQECLALLQEADGRLITLGESTLSAHLSLVIELLKQRLPPQRDLPGQ